MHQCWRWRYWAGLRPVLILRPARRSSILPSTSSWTARLLLMQRRSKCIKLLLQLSHPTICLLLPLPTRLGNHALSTSLGASLARYLGVCRILIAAYFQSATRFTSSRSLRVVRVRPIIRTRGLVCAILLMLVLHFWARLIALASTISDGRLLRCVRLWCRVVVWLRAWRSSICSLLCF